MKGIDPELWAAFSLWCETNRVSLDHAEDWKPWWDCFKYGVEVQKNISERDQPNHMEL